MKHNEDSRVKIPAILHLTRLGYQYLPLTDVDWDHSTNIAKDIFSESMLKINKGLDQRDVDRLLSDISIELDNDDLGRVFYQRLIEQSGTKLIDFDNFNKNSFHVVTELTYKKDEEEFRPDITRNDHPWADEPQVKDLEPYALSIVFRDQENHEAKLYT